MCTNIAIITFSHDKLVWGGERESEWQCANKLYRPLWRHVYSARTPTL